MRGLFLFFVGFASLFLVAGGDESFFGRTEGRVVKLNSAEATEKAFSDSSFNCSEPVCAIIRRTTVLSKCCKNMPQGPGHIWPLLITGTPRSGTVFTHHVLNALGVKVHNDWGNPDRDGILSWIHFYKRAKDDYFGPGRLSGGRFKVVIHLVRDPLKSITSIGCTEGMVGNSEQPRFIRGNIPFDEKRFPGDHKLGLGLQMWVEYHTAMSQTGAPLWRLEDLFADRFNKTKQLFTLLGTLAPKYPSTATIDHAFDSKAHPHNNRGHRGTVTWGQLFRIDAVLAMRAWLLSESYGYHYDFDIQKALMGADHDDHHSSLTGINCN